MSDSRTHVEIEDVLSSIRRLVSQDGHAPRRTGLYRAAESQLHAPEPTTGEPETGTPECLVLTPALRVVDRPSDAEPQPLPAAPDPQPEFAPAGDLLASPPPAESDAHGWPDTAAPYWDETAAALSLEAALTDTAPATPDSAALEDFAPVFDAEYPAPAPPADSNLTDEISRLENTIAELEAAVAASDDAFEPEQGDPFAQAAGLAAAFAAEEGVAAEHAPAETQAPQVRAAPPEAARPEPEMDFAEAPDLGGAPDGAASDADAGEPLAAEAVEWVDPVDPLDAELTALDWAEEADTANEDATEPPELRRLHFADAQPEAQPHEPPTSSYMQMQSEAAQDLRDAVDENLLDLGENMLIDEASLRALVSELIREELQGTLGERITRSVRKLVRREIARALAGRDLV